MPSIKKMREVCQQRRPNAKGKMVWAEHWFNRLVTRWFSIYITWVCVKLNISANTVSILMIISGIVGFALCIPHLLWLNIAGALLLLGAECLDCVDGEPSGCNKKNLRGKYLELIYRVLCKSLFSCICGLQLYAIYREEKYLILAFLAYAMSQIRLDFKAVFFRITVLLPKRDSLPGYIESITPTKHNKSLCSHLLGAAKWLLLKGFDENFLRIATITTMIIAHLGFEWPMIFLAWWFVILGAGYNINEIVNKYFVVIPETGHTNQV